MLQNQWKDEGVIVFFFFNYTATTEICPLPLHGALPLLAPRRGPRPGPPRLRRLGRDRLRPARAELPRGSHPRAGGRRSEEHTSELQSRQYLVCRLLLEKKNTTPRLTAIPSPRRRFSRHF